MSANLGNSAQLVKNTTFRETVAAAMVEQALLIVVPKPATDRDRLAAAVIYDVTGLNAFVAACADDATISEAGTGYDPADVARVVAEQWDTVAGVIPNLGGLL